MLINLSVGDLVYIPYMLTIGIAILENLFTNDLVENSSHFQNLFVFYIVHLLETRKRNESAWKLCMYYSYKPMVRKDGGLKKGSLVKGLAEFDMKRERMQSVAW